MKILVTVKEVATVQDDFELAGTAIEDQYLQYALNEWDEYAIETAVQLAEAHGDVEVVAVTIGPERSEETIRVALAKGADRAVRVWDDAIESQSLLDVATKVEILAAVVDEERPDLVLSGVQATDDAFGATGVALAAAVDFQWAAVVNALDLDREAGVANVHRELEGGVEEVTTIDLPAVLTIQTGINEPRYASLRGIRMAQRKEIAETSLADLGIDPASVESSLELIDVYEPDSESDVELIDGAPAEAATTLATVLREKGVGAK